MPKYGEDAYTRHQHLTSIYDPTGSKALRRNERENKRTDFDVLKAQHRFLRDDGEAELEDDRGEGSSKHNAWEKELARKYEDSLFKEYALIDLKHYKSGRFALRWRTSDEVIQSIGATTCGSLRCAFHNPPAPTVSESIMPSLKIFELPFAYEEDGKAKQALVKVCLCRKCEKKLGYRKKKDVEDTEGKVR